MTGFCCLDEDFDIIAAPGAISTGAAAGSAFISNTVSLSMGGTTATFIYSGSWDAGQPDSFGRFLAMQSSASNNGNPAQLQVDQTTDFSLLVSGGAAGMFGSILIYRNGIVANVSIGETATVTLGPGLYDVFFRASGGNATGTNVGGGTVFARLQAVPEPSAALLLAVVGLLGLVHRDQALGASSDSTLSTSSV